MQLSDSIVLVCAVFASLASGVLVAYGLCQAMFGLFRIHARQVRIASAPSSPERLVPAPAQPVEG
jgi:hypothetical protein